MPTITFKVSADEARWIRRLAKHKNLSVSEYLRRCASGTGGTGAAPRLVRCEFTGAMVFAPLGESQSPTTGTVREMLADFP